MMCVSVVPSTPVAVAQADAEPLAAVRWQRLIPRARRYGLWKA